MNFVTVSLFNRFCSYDIRPQTVSNLDSFIEIPWFSKLSLNPTDVPFCRVERVTPKASGIQYYPLRCISLLRQGTSSGSPHVPSRLTCLNRLMLLCDLEFINVVEVDEAQGCALRMGGSNKGGKL